MNYRVVTAITARNDMAAIADHISEFDSVSGAAFTPSVVAFYSDKLSYMPTKYPRYQERLPLRLMKYDGRIRKLVFNKKTLVYFVIDDERKEVRVLHVKRAKKPLEIYG